MQRYSYSDTPSLSLPIYLKDATMIVLSSINGEIGLPAALAVMQAGGSALDAVETGTRLVERNAADHSVGLGGLPNLLGEVRLDAAIMDGQSLRSGAVGSVRGYAHVISLARRVMEETPHVFLVGDGAERFAREMGMEPEALLTAAAHARWRETLLRCFPDLDLELLAAQPNLRALVQALNQPMAGWEPLPPHGTVNFIAQDSGGNIAAAVSTSGWAWGYPGRLGDSPVIGAGCYADNRWGAAASTGTGEVTIRTAATRSLILYLKMGLPLAAAAREVFADLADLQDPYVDHIALIALNAAGDHVGLTRRPQERYAYLTAGMDEPATVPMAPAR